MSDIHAWDITDADNNSSPPDGAPEGMLPSTFNDVLRANMGAGARWYQDQNASLTSTGSSNAYVVAGNQTYAALSDVGLLVFKANHANTGAATLQVDSLIAKTIKKNHDVDLASGDIEANQVVIVSYNATDDVFEIVSQLSARDTTADGTKLDGIEANATADQTAGEIEAIVSHDNLIGFVANEHIDWTNATANFKTTGSIMVGDFSAEEKIHAREDNAGGEGASLVLMNRNSTAGSSVAIKLQTSANSIFDGRYSKIEAVNVDGATGADIILSPSQNGAGAAEALRLVGADQSAEFAGSVVINSHLNVGDDSELTISSGAVTATKAFHKLDTESDAATDDLNTINGGTEGDLLLLKAANSLRDVVIKHGTGNISLDGGVDFTLDHKRDKIFLVYDDSEWHEISRSTNG